MPGRAYSRVDLAPGTVRCGRVFAPSRFTVPPVGRSPGRSRGHGHRCLLTGFPARGSHCVGAPPVHLGIYRLATGQPTGRHRRETASISGFVGYRVLLSGGIRPERRKSDTGQLRAEAARQTAHVAPPTAPILPATLPTFAPASTARRQPSRVRLGGPVRPSAVRPDGPGRCRRGRQQPRRRPWERSLPLLSSLRMLLRTAGGGRPVGRADRPAGGGPGRAVRRRADPQDRDVLGRAGAGRRVVQQAHRGDQDQQGRGGPITGPDRPAGGSRPSRAAPTSAELADTAYKTGGLRTVDALLRPGGSAALLDRLGTLDQLTRQRQAAHLRLHRRTSGGCSTRRPGWTPRWPGRPRRPAS